jgi:hypothetical protein
MSSETESELETGIRNYTSHMEDSKHMSSI